MKKDWSSSGRRANPADSPSDYRPICLLDDECKLFERIVAARVFQHLEVNGEWSRPARAAVRIPEGPQHSGRYTPRTIPPDEAVQEDKIILVVVLDIFNAFNILPWDRIGRPLYTH